MKTFEIYFSDLSEQAKVRFLVFEDIDNEQGGNYEFIPLAIIEREEEFDA